LGAMYRLIGSHIRTWIDWKHRNSAMKESFPKAVRLRAMLSCRRCCCLCHKLCGIKMECH